MELVRVTKENIEREHICCAISGGDDIMIKSKKSWMSERFDDGLVFLKGNVRGKCFIEYIPAEFAWVPIHADGYMYIDCLWVSGKYKEQGNSNLLLNECIADSKDKGKKGLVILSSKKKEGFLADSKYLAYKGFKLCDSKAPYFELWYLLFEEDAAKPAFADVKVSMDNGFTLYYTAQCPFTAKYVPIIAKMARERAVEFRAIQFKTAAEAQNAPCPFTTYSLYWNGEFITHEILSEKKFEKLLNLYAPKE